MTQLDLLARLHPTSSARMKAPLSAVSVAALRACVEKREGTLVYRAGQDHFAAWVDTGGGENLSVSLSTSEINVEAKLPKHDEDGEEVLLDLAGEVVQDLQQLSGWHVVSAHLLDFNLEGTCAACGTEWFRWQDFCASCGAPVEGDAEPPLARGRTAILAKELVARLVREGRLELRPGAAPRAVEKVLTDAFARGHGASVHLLRALIDCPDVDELYSDAEELQQTIRDLQDR